MSDSQDTALRLSITEGCIATVMGSLAGGAFLTGFALYLGASDFQIGLLSSLPPLVSMIQLATHWLLRKTGERKKLTVWTMGLSRSLWLVIALLPVFFFTHRLELQFRIVLWIIVLSTALNSIGLISWWSWMSDLVPRDILGQYFSKRNLWTGIVGMLVFYAGTAGLDFYKRHVPVKDYGYGFTGLFLIAVVFGLYSIRLLSRIPELGKITHSQKIPAFHELVQPLKDKNFRLFMFERSAWFFSVCIAAPYFNVYLLKHLKVSWSYIGLLNIIATVASLYCLKLWGRIVDQFGCKPLMNVSCMAKTLFPLVWIIVTPSNYWWILIFTHLLCSFDSAINLTSSNLLLKLSPRGNNVAYLAIDTACINLACAVSPLLGGWLVLHFAQNEIFHLPILGDTDALKCLFFLSGSTRLLTAWTLERIKEPDTRSVSYMFRVLREVKGFVPIGSELNQTFQFWFSPFDDMLYILRRRGQHLTKRIRKSLPNLSKD